MSLTRTEWEEMWKSIKYVESVAQHLREPRRGLILEQVVKIKGQIQSVIGQME